MNQINLQIASLPTNQTPDIIGGSLKPGKDSGDFLSLIQKSRGPVQNKSISKQPGSPQDALPDKEGYLSALESLRRGLLSKGKPLNKIFLTKEDLPLIKQFLSQCGFSKEDAEKFLRGLLTDNPKGKISLSEFFLKIKDLDHPTKKTEQPAALETSAIPYIESLLRDFGLTPKQIDNALSASKAEGGGLDLAKFVVKLKEAGVGIKDKGEGGQVSIKDFITALERMTGRAGNGNQLPADVKATIGQMVERANVAEDSGSISSLRSFSTPGLTDRLTKENIDKKGVVNDKSGQEKAFVNDRNGRQDVEAFLKERGKGEDKNGQLKNGSPHPARKVEFVTDLDAGRGSKIGVKQVGPVANPETKAVEVSQDISRSNFSETINSVKQNQGTARNPLPAYLINQVGKQISRSMLRGDRVFRLQIRPPELGAVKIEMDIKGDVLRLGIVAENSSVKELLLSHVNELRDTLIEQGMKIEKLDVQINQGFNHSLTNSKKELKEGQRGFCGQKGGPLSSEGDAGDSVSGRRARTLGDRLLNLVA